MSTLIFKLNKLKYSCLNNPMLIQQSLDNESIPQTQQALKKVELIIPLHTLKKCRIYKLTQQILEVEHVKLD